MLVYLAAGATSLVFACLAELQKQRYGASHFKTIAFLALSCLPLLSVQIFREGVGTDYNEVYVAEYNEYVRNGLSRFEPGFTAMMWAARFIGADYHLVIGICAFISVSCVYIAVYRSHAKYPVAIFLYLVCGFFFFSMNGIRQGVAVSILLNAVICFDSGNRKKFVLLVLLASSVHLYSIIFLILLCFRGQFRIKYGIVPPLFVAVALLSGPISSLLISIGAKASRQIATYASVPHLRELYLTGDFDVLDFVICSSALMVSSLVSKKTGANSRACIDSGCGMMLLFGVLATAVSRSMAISSRLAVYFSPFTMIYIGELCAREQVDNNKRAKWVLSLYFLMMLAVFLYIYGLKNFSSVLPYSTWIHL